MQVKLKICDNCKLPKVIFRTRERKHLCKQCNSILYSVAKPTVCKKFIAPRSSKRAKQEQEYMKLRDQFLKDHPVCMFPGCLKKENLDLHHIKGKIGKLLTDVKFFSVLCREHHTFIHCNPLIAKELGLIKSKLE